VCVCDVCVCVCVRVCVRVCVCAGPDWILLFAHSDADRSGKLVTLIRQTGRGEVKDTLGRGSERGSERVLERVSERVLERCRGLHARGESKIAVFDCYLVSSCCVCSSSCTRDLS
jgi:hypothetical protein